MRSFEEAKALLQQYISSDIVTPMRQCSCCCSSHGGGKARYQDYTDIEVEKQVK